MPVERPHVGDGAEQIHPPGEASSDPIKTPELIPPEAVRPPPEARAASAIVEIEIVDVVKLEEGRRERNRARDRERHWQRYHELKQAALSGDADALQYWERLRQQKREARRQWRQNHPEEHYRQVQKWKQKPDSRARAAAYARKYYRRKKEEAAEGIASIPLEEYPLS